MSGPEYHIGDLAKIISPSHKPDSSKKDRKLFTWFSGTNHEGQKTSSVDVTTEPAATEKVKNPKKKKKSHGKVDLSTLAVQTSSDRSPSKQSAKKKKQKQVNLDTGVEKHEVLPNEIKNPKKKKKKKSHGKVDLSTLAVQTSSDRSPSKQSAKKKKQKQVILNTSVVKHKVLPSAKKPHSAVKQRKKEVNIEADDDDSNQEMLARKKTETASTKEVSNQDLIDTKKKKKKKKKKDVSGNQVHSPHAPGFCPPPGIVHESLTKSVPNKKRKQVDTANSDDEDGSPKSSQFSGREKQRKRRKEKIKNKRTVFVGNLPISFVKKDLKKLFKGFGKIESVRFRCPPPADPTVPKKVTVIKKEFHPERTNIIAYVCFKEEESAQKALSCNGKKLDNLHIRVDLASQDKEHDQKHSIFVGNLPFDIEEEAIHRHFERCGPVKNVRIIRDSKSGLGKGIGYVLFKKTDAVHFALQLDKSELKGRELRVMNCTESQRSKNKSSGAKPNKRLKSAASGGNSNVEKKTAKQSTEAAPKKISFKPSNAPSGSFQGLLARQQLKKKQQKLKKKKQKLKTKIPLMKKTKSQKGIGKPKHSKEKVSKQKTKGSAKQKRKT